MKYIDSIIGGLIAFLVFIILVLLLPGKGPSDDVKLILTVSTFLFAILAGFFIARSSSRFNHIRQTVGTEDALFLALYKTSQVYGKKFQNKIRELIDKYYVVAYDVELASQSAYKENMPYFLKIWDLVTKLKGAASSKIIDILKDLEINRNLATTISKEKIAKGQWAVLIVLSLIIIFSLFYLNTNEFYSMIVTILLSTVLIIVLLILRDLQNLKFGGEALLSESGQEVFEVMGKLRYYNISYMDQGWYKVPKSIKKYRLGYHKLGEKPDIRIIVNN